MTRHGVALTSAILPFRAGTDLQLSPPPIDFGDDHTTVPEVQTSSVTNREEHTELGISNKRNSTIQVTRETHEAAPSVHERLKRAGGTNRFGEPNFRVVWGGSRLGWIGGRWIDRDLHGNVIREAIELRREPKYMPVNRWHIERWMPPESYGSPEQWYAQTIETEDGIRIPALGPYPSRGEYEHCFTLAGTNGEFLALSPAACDWIVRAIEWARRRPAMLAKQAITRRESRRECGWDRLADDIFDDSVPAFHARPFVVCHPAAKL